MKIGLYFGSFNPIHNGHIHIAQEALSQCDLGEVWLMVSPQNPFKKASDLAPEEDRLNMARIACEGFRNIHVSDIEFSLPRPSFTITTLKKLCSDFPENTFYLILGEDNIGSLNQWKDITELLTIVEVIVYPRAGSDSVFPSELKAFNDKFQWLKGKHIEVSATEVRHHLKAGLPLHTMLHVGVAEYILSHHLYSS